MLVGANHLGSVMHSELKQLMRVTLFPLVENCYNISIFNKGNGKPFVLFQRKYDSHSRVEKGNNILLKLTNGTKSQGLIVHQV